MIEDEELRHIFKTASEEHLQKLDEGFLHLEKSPNDPAKLEELLREAHSLKGDAGMLGVKEVATLSHQIEHLLGNVKRGEIKLSSEISDRLYFGLDAIRKLVGEAVTGEPSGVSTFYVLAYLMGAETKADPKSIDSDSHREENAGIEPNQSPDIAPQPLETELIQTRVSSVLSHGSIEPQTPPVLPVAHKPPQHQPISEPPIDTKAIASVIEEQTSKEESPKISNFQSQIPTASRNYERVDALKTYRIDTIRVETRHLDSLMTEAGELTVTKVGINNRLNEIEEIASLCEEWSRDIFINRFMLEEIDTRLALWFQQNIGNSSLERFQDFYHRVEGRLERLGALVNRLKNKAYEDTQRLETITDELAEGIRSLRLLPLSTIFNLFPRMVRDLAKQEGKDVNLVIEGGESKADKRILEEMKDPLMHLIRNAIDHGIETPRDRQELGKLPTATLQLKGYQTTTHVIIEVIDDGRGLNLEKIKQTALNRGICREEELAIMTPNQIQSLIFEPGFSTRTFVTEISGRGVGLDVVRTNVEQLKGTIQVESLPLKGCTIRVQLPTTLTTAHVLIVAVDGISYAIPVEFVLTARFVSPDDIFTIEGRDTMILDAVPVSVAKLADLLEIKQEFAIGPLPATHPCIILKVGEELLGLLVDALLAEQDVMLKPQSQLLKRVRNVSGATILGTGEVCTILNPQDLIKSVRKQAVSIEPDRTIKVERKQTILLVEDSIAIRTQEKRILEGAGYEVVTAVDGLDGFNKLRTRSFDAVVSDVQMPHLDGLALTAKIRQYREYRELPIILVTSLASDEDKKQGAIAGANAYITKGTFNQEVLLETLKRLV